jgi:twinkle protein
MLDHSAQRDHSYIGVILSKITEFCQQTNTHLFLVAHPKKLEKNQGKYAVPGLYDISGSADFYNKCYNGIVCYRHVGVRTGIGSDLVEVFVEKVKRKENGGLGSFEIAPDFNNGGIYEPASENDKIFDAVPKPEPAPKIDIKHLENDLKKIPF